MYGTNATARREAPLVFIQARDGVPRLPIPASQCRLPLVVASFVPLYGIIPFYPFATRTRRDSPPLGSPRLLAQPHMHAVLLSLVVSLSRVPVRLFFLVWVFPV